MPGAVSLGNSWRTSTMVLEPFALIHVALCGAVSSIICSTWLMGCVLFLSHSFNCSALVSDIADSVKHTVENTVKYFNGCFVTYYYKSSSITWYEGPVGLMHGFTLWSAHASESFPDVSQSLLKEPSGWTVVPALGIPYFLTRHYNIL